MYARESCLLTTKGISLNIYDLCHHLSVRPQLEQCAYVLCSTQCFLRPTQGPYARLHRLQLSIGGRPLARIGRLLVVA